MFWLCIKMNRIYIEYYYDFKVYFKAKMHSDFL